MSGKKKKEIDEKKYSIFSNLLYTCRWLAGTEGAGAVFVCVLDVILSIILPFASVALPSAVVAFLSSGRKTAVIILMLTGYVAALQLLRILAAYVNETRKKALFVARVDGGTEYFEKCIDIDYQAFESSKGQKKMDDACLFCYGGNDYGVEGFLKSNIDTFVSLGGMLIYGIIIGKSSLFILLVLVILTAVTAYANYLAARRGDRIHEKEYWKNEEEFNYLKKETIASANGKDIRLYRMSGWFMDSFSKLIDNAVRITDKEQTGILEAGIVEKLLASVRDGGVYAYFIYSMAVGDMGLSTFLLYIGLVAGFGNLMSGFFGGLTEVFKNNRSINKYRDFLEYGVIDESGRTEHVKKDIPHEIRLENVSFRYEGESEDTIKNLSLTIKSGEKLALVGMNGAGKTTLIKLICGLYTPSSGHIYLDGVDMRKIAKKEYFQEFSVVFQDVFAFSFSLADNVACRDTEDTDGKKLWEVLGKADLADKVHSLEKGAFTMMNKDLDESGVTLSGGEMQRLMLARALYKNAPVVILDEPTAALDPIAESNMYEKYNELTTGKTSIFISHRLSSTRFCDRILFMEKGRIIEEGSHELLMEKQGAYANMYEVQAHYYQKNIDKEDECYA